MKTLLVVLFISANIFAGVKDKKQIAENGVKLDKAVKTVNDKCGSKAKVVVAWNEWDSYDFSKIQSDKAKVLSNVALLIEDTFNNIVKLCADKDFKAEIAKLTDIKVGAKQGLDSRYIQFDLEKTALNMKLNVDGVGSWKNEKALKAVWE